MPADDLRIVAATVITTEYVPWLRLVSDSFFEHHPDARHVALVIGGIRDEDRRPSDRFEVVLPEDLGIGDDEMAWFRLVYDNLQLTWGLKPPLLRRLVDEADAVLYLNANSCVYAPLDGVARLAADTGLALSPHTLAPPPDDPRLDTDDEQLSLGQFNGGFLAVTAKRADFLDWWTGKTRRECPAHDEFEPLRYGDQRWLDLVVNYFPFAVDRDPGNHVARWNLYERELEYDNGAFTARGLPLRLFHFSWFDPDKPLQQRPTEGGHPSSDPKRAPAYRAAIEDYLERLQAAGWEPGSKRNSESLGTTLSGVTMTKWVRAAIRFAVIAAERVGAVPADGANEPDRVLRWLRSAATPGGLSWYLLGLQRYYPPIQSMFPSVPGADEQRLIEWSVTDGPRYGLVPPVLSGPALPFSLDGVRSTAVLVRADEVLEDPTLLNAIRTALTAADEVTVVIYAPGADADGLLGQLEPLVAGAGLDADDAPDLLVTTDAVGPDVVAPLVSVLLTRRDSERGFSELTRATNADLLRALLAAGRRPSGL